MRMWLNVHCGPTKDLIPMSPTTSLGYFGGRKRRLSNVNDHHNAL